MRGCEGVRNRDDISGALLYVFLRVCFVVGVVYEFGRIFSNCRFYG